MTFVTGACQRLECQTTGGCAHRGPQGQVCWFQGGPTLSQFTDEQIAAEYHRRALQKLGDQRVGVTMPTGPGFAGLPEHHQPFAGKR